MRGRLILAGVLGFVGLIWIGQGTGLLGGTGFMVNDVRWAVAGLVLVVLAAVLLVSAVRSTRTS